MQPKTIEQQLKRILLKVTKPGRYVGGEFNSIVKDWDSTDFKVALAFPDIYDLGMSNLGIMILYEQINKQPDMLAERVFSVWDDMEQLMRAEGIPLYSLENKRSIREFDLLGISLPYEQLFTNVLNMLDLAGMPVRSEDRDESFPLVIAGGHSCYNPEPMADFIDAFVIGEGEEIIVEVARTMQAMRGHSRFDQLRAIARIQGMYVPRFYDVTYDESGIIIGTAPNVPEAPKRVLKRIVPTLPKPFTKFLIPNIDTVHNRAPIEIMRGCTRGCRFCHAGMITRPVRERTVEEVMTAIQEIITSTGFEEISLLSLSSSDYVYVHELADAVHDASPAAAGALVPKQFIVFFGFDRFDLTPEAARVVGDAVDAAKRSGAVALTIVGHTDSSGSPRYNQALSQRRANAVRAELLALGVPAAGVTASGHGEGELIVKTADGVQEPQNRRATIDLE